MGDGEFGRFSLDLSPITTYAFGRLIPSVRTFEQSTNKEGIFAKLEIPGHDVVMVPEFRLNVQYDLLKLDNVLLGITGGGIFGYGGGSGVDNPFLEFGWQAGPKVTIPLMNHFALGVALLYSGRHIMGLDTSFDYTMHGATGELGAIFYPIPNDPKLALLLTYGYSGFFNPSINGYEGGHDLGFAVRISFGADKKENKILADEGLQQETLFGEGLNLVKQIGNLKNDDWFENYANEMAVRAEGTVPLWLEAINDELIWLTSGYPEYESQLSKEPFEKIKLKSTIQYPWKGMPSLREYLATVYRLADAEPDRRRTADLIQSSRKMVSDIYHFLVNKLEDEQKRIRGMGMELGRSIGAGADTARLEIDLLRYKMQVQKYNAVLKRARHVFSFLNVQHSYYFVGTENVFDDQRSHLNRQITEGWCLEEGRGSPTTLCAADISVTTLERRIKAIVEGQKEPE